MPQTFIGNSEAQSNLYAELLPLLPENENGEVLSGLTTTSHPAFFAYVANTSATEAFFSIKGEDGNYHYEQTMQIPSEPGILKIALPKTYEIALEPNETYQWFLALKCSGELEPSSPTVRGFVKRVEAPLSLQTRLSDATLLDQAILFGQNGIWYDTLDKLYASVQTGATQVTQWSNLLDSVGLDEVSKKPLVD